MSEWNTGHVIPWWDESYKDLNYVYYPLTNTHDEERWKSEGYSKLTLNGGLYDFRQPMPNYGQPFFEIFDWKNVGVSFYRMLTCEALPLHVDSYTSFRKKFNVAPEQMWRCIVFLEDWKSGHYFEIDNIAYCNWIAGDYVYWNNAVPHYAGNFGLEPRYTVQITGMSVA